MESVPPDGAAEPATRAQSTTAIKKGLRDLGLGLSLLNRKVGARLALKDVDLDCLDLISAYGPLGPNALARRAGVHPATVTGILDRLEKAGWVAREPDPADRRGTLVRALRDRTGELLAHFGGMTASVEEICASYPPEELAVLADFLRRTAEAGHLAAAELARP